MKNKESNWKTYIPRKVPLNWYRFDLKFSIELLEVFIKNAESQIDLSIKEYSSKTETLVLDKIPEKNSDRIVDVHQGLDSESWNLDGIFKEYFPTLQRRSAFLSLYGFLEHELDKLCMLYKKSQNQNVDFGDLKDLGIERSVKYLMIVAGLPIEKGNNKWGNVKSIQKIRNLIVHNDGKLIDLDNRPRKTEQRIVSDNDFLSGENEIIMQKGYLLYVLETFDSFFKYVDGLIQDQNGIITVANKK